MSNPAGQPQQNQTSQPIINIHQPATDRYTQHLPSVAEKPWDMRLSGWLEWMLPDSAALRDLILWAVPRISVPSAVLGFTKLLVQLAPEITLYAGITLAVLGLCYFALLLAVGLSDDSWRGAFVSVFSMILTIVGLVMVAIHA